MAEYKAVTAVYAKTYKSVGTNNKGKSANNTILMGSWVEILGETKGEWQKVKAFGKEGWIEMQNLGDSPGLKCCYIDVGQGDAALIEVGNDANGMKILIDGGPADNVSRYFNAWQYKYYLSKGIKVHFDYVFISHFDKDHYNGLIDIINDENYTFGTIFHNGIGKFSEQKDEQLPKEYNCKLGKKVKVGSKNYLITLFDTLEELQELRNKGGMQDLLVKFLKAVEKAKTENRLSDFKRLDSESLITERQFNNKSFKIEVLAPVPTSISGKAALPYYEDDSHTINGNSLVLKISYGLKTFLFGGDLNIPSEEYLIDHYSNQNPFRVDVAKSCHHGASEFTTAFMDKVCPYVTVISSGDNESYSHPRADAIGCAGKYARSERPLVFSTELARSVDISARKVMYGMINMRCDGDKLIMAQMKEVRSNDDVWDLYEVII